MDDHELIGVDSELPPAAFRWDLLHDKDRSDTLEALSTFVSWLVERYRLHRHIPPCWAEHGAYTEELSALWIAWRGVMEMPDRTDAWLAWHDHLHRLIDRCRDLWSTGCTLNRHNSPLAAHPGAPTVSECVVALPAENATGGTASATARLASMRQSTG